jgi:folate-dependent phosphoribosylglycinamide formyltransferase PurN
MSYSKPKNTCWTAMFSRTGYELYCIIKKLKILPTQIICNRKPIKDGIDERFWNFLQDQQYDITFVVKSPAAEEYDLFLQPPDRHVITLHGWMRIVPPTVCDKFNIYNGHPGDIMAYPELKGKDPQQKAHDLGHTTIGTVIHEVIPEVDNGPVLSTKKIKNTFKDVESISIALREESIALWADFLKQKIS